MNRPPPRSERTIYPRTVTNPLRGEQLARAKAEEAARKKWDPSYLTADEARSMPQDVAERPENAARIQYSRSQWPENRAAARVALGPLPTGEGQVVQERTVDAGSVFGGSKVEP